LVQRKFLIVGATLAVLVVGVSLSVFTLTNTGGQQFEARLPNAPEYVCPAGMPQSECAQLTITCGNGVVDPGEDCRNCAFDAGCASGLVCGNISGGDEYTCHYPAGLCLAGPAG
jgi:hypothetical protein